MFSAARLSRTVLIPQAPIAIAPVPKTIRTTLAAIPPYLNQFLMATPFSFLTDRSLEAVPLHAIRARPPDCCGNPTRTKGLGPYRRRQDEHHGRATQDPGASPGDLSARDLRHGLHGGQGEHGAGRKEQDEDVDKRILASCG